MGFKYGSIFFVVLCTGVCCLAQWDKVNYQGNLKQTISQHWYQPSTRWQGYNAQQSQNSINNYVRQSPQNQLSFVPSQTNPGRQGQNFSVKNRQNKLYSGTARGSVNGAVNSPQSGKGPSYLHTNTLNVPRSIPAVNPAYQQTSPSPQRVTDFVKSANLNQYSRQVGQLIRHGKFLQKVPKLSLSKTRASNSNQHIISEPMLSDQIVAGSLSNGGDDGGPRDFISKQRISSIKPKPHPNQLSGDDSPQKAYHDSMPADVQVSGNPNTDKMLGVKVSTPEKIYDLNVERISNSILHEDIRFLTVSVENGKTVFKEQFKTVDLQAKAKEMNYFHDLQSGTFLSVQAHRKNSGEKPQNFIEGVLFDELIVAAPQHQKRHKRSLYPDTHTVYRKDSVHDGAFHFDTVEVPNAEELIKASKPHIRKKRQFRGATISSPSRSSQSRTQDNQPPSRIEPELLLFVDFALFREFEGDSNELLEYLLHFWHAVNWKYLTIALSGSWPVIDLKIREIGVFKEPNAQPFIESSRISHGSKLFSLYDAMDSLQKWLIRYENALPIHDIAFLQTGENACRKVKSKSGVVPYNPPNIFKTLRQGPSMKDSKNEECVTGTAGVAYVRGACLSAPMLRGNAFNFGIGEASNSFNGVIIAAHEVGHLLGAYHDGEADANGCSPKSGYIMSYTRDDSYKFSRFSDCSIRSFQNFLRMDRSKCLRQRSSRDTLKFPTTFPGKFMSLRQQCLRFTGGPPCEEGPTQCEHLCCDDRKGEWRYTRSEPAVDGTECSNMKVCLNGQCVPLATIGK